RPGQRLPGQHEHRPVTRTRGPGPAGTRTPREPACAPAWHRLRRSGRRAVGGDDGVGVDDGEVGDTDVGADLRAVAHPRAAADDRAGDRKSTRLNSSHVKISYAVFCLKK